MKLWKIKAQALRIMFADSDTKYSEDDFKSGGIIEANPNTNAYVIGMEDSIRRAIDVYYQMNGQISQMTTLTLDFDYTNEDGVLVTPEEGDDLTLLTKVYKNIISTSSIANFGMPTRIDIVENAEEGIRGTSNVNFYFDNISGEIVFTEYDMAYFEGNISFICYYRMKKLNLPYDVDQMTYEMNDLYIPEEVQRKIPLFIKGELYEEDEPNIAQAAMNEYMNFLAVNKRSTFSRKHGKVKVKYPRG